MSEKTARKSKTIGWLVWSLLAILAIGVLAIVIAPFWLGFAAMNQLGDHVERGMVFGDAPEWTPDGSQIVFDHRGGIYAVNRDGSGLNRIHGSDGEDYHSAAPRLSPDGSRIAYSRFLESRDYWTTMTSELDGSDERTLTKSVSDSQFGTRGRYQSGHAWSPDGSRIAFFNNFYLYTIGADGSDLLRLAERDFSSTGRQLAWSPDGSHIAFSANSSLHLVKADGSGATELVKEDEETRIGSPTWSPDGSRIAFAKWSHVSDDDGQYPWQVVALSGSNFEAVHQVADGFHSYNHIYELDWSPDGSNLLMLGYYSISAVGADGSNLRTLLNLQPNHPRQLKASWSPDGSKIAVYNGGGYEGVLFTMSPDGFDKRVLALSGNPPRPAQNQAWDSAYDAPTPTP